MKQNLIIIGLIIFGYFFSCSSPIAPKKRPSTTIASDTIWASKGIYHISQDLYVKALLSIGDSSKVFVDSATTIYVGSGTATAILRIGKGVTFYFGKGANIYLCYGDEYLTGAIIANGTATDSIKFTTDSSCTQWGFEGTQDKKNSGGIRIGYGATDRTSFKYCIIENASVGINIASDSFAITNSTIRHCSNEGVIINGGHLRDSNAFANNSIIENGGFPVAIGAEDVGKLSLSNRFDTSLKKGIFVRGEYCYSSSTWQNFNCPYIIDGNIQISDNSTLTIAPGCRLEFTPSTSQKSSYIYASGLLVAQGTPTDSIVFTRSDDSGSWGYYPTYTGNDGIRSAGGIIGKLSIRYCVIEFSTVGINTWGAKISNTTIRNCLNAGMVGNPLDSQSFIDNTITQNGGYPIMINANQVGKLSGSGNLLGNAKNGIYVYSGDIGSNAIWKKHAIPYIIDSCMTISSALVTILPGCRLEFSKPNSYLGVGCISQGTLIAIGTPDDSIVFTKTDGTVWWGYAMGGLWIGRLATNSTNIQYCNISCSTSGIYAESSVYIQNCQIHDNKYYGIDFATTGLDVNVMNNTFSNNLLGNIHQ